MYLSELSVEEKQAFLQLAYYMAKTDGIYADEERALLSEYAKECDYHFNEPESSIQIQDILSSLKSSTNKSKRIIFLEITAMALIDTKFENEEKAFLAQVAKAFSIPDSDIEEAVNLCDDYLTIGLSLNNFIIKED